MARGPGLALPSPWILMLAAVIGHAAAQNQCVCPTNKMTVCDERDPSGRCQCRVLGSNQAVNCSTLTSKCLLLKARMRASHSGRALVRPSEHALLDNDGLYDPDCDQQGRFKARQCNQTSVCWCVNSVGVRRTDKGDLSLQCDEVVRTYHILIDLRHRPDAPRLQPLGPGRRAAAALPAALSAAAQVREGCALRAPHHPDRAAPELVAEGPRRGGHRRRRVLLREGRQGRVAVPRPPRPQLARGRTAPGPGADARLLPGREAPPVLHEAPRQRPHRRHRGGRGGGGRRRGRPGDHQSEEVRKVQEGGDQGTGGDKTVTDLVGTGGAGVG